MKKRMLAMVMAIVMVMTLLPTSALAVGGDTGLQEGQVRATKALVVDDNNQPVKDLEGYYTVEITVQGKPKQAKNGSNADVVLVVDNSGSMSNSVGEPCNTPKEQFREEDTLVGKHYTCPTCGAKYNPFWDTIPDYCTGQKDKTSRIDAAKDVSKEFANSILAGGTGNQLAVIGFAHEKYYGGANDTGAIKVAQPLTETLSDVNNAIDHMKADGGTNYTAALAKAQEYLTGRSENDKATRPGYVIFISDGAPGYSGGSLHDSQWNGSTQIEQLKTAGITVYTVGIALEPEAANYLKSMASKNQEEHFINVSPTKYKDEMNEILQTWATKINSIPAGRNAMITDVVNTGEFEYKMEDTPEVTNDTATGTITWNIGEITEKPQSIQFKVKPKADKHGTLYTNESVELSYTACDGEKKQIRDTKKIAEPQIGDPHIEIANPARAYTVEYYYDDVMGVAPTGAPAGGTANVGATVTISAGDSVGTMQFPKKTTVDTENYAFDEDAENVLNTTIVEDATKNVLKVYYAKDENGNGKPDYKDDKYTITYAAGAPEGEVTNLPEAVDVLADTEQTVSTKEPTRKGYTFSRWQAPEGLAVTDAGKFTMPAENVTFTAQWTPNDVTITFDANGGRWEKDVAGYEMKDKDNNTKATKASKTYKPSAAVAKIPTDPVRDGKTFNGWYVKIPKKPGEEPEKYFITAWGDALQAQSIQKYDGVIYADWDDAAQPTEKLNYTIHQHYIGSNGKQDAQFNDELPKTASAGTKISGLIPAELQKDRKYYYQTYIYLSSETKIVNDNVATPVADDTVLNKDNTQIHLYYYLDAWNDENNTLTGGDGIPDKYQAVVTYKVVGGTWKDGKTDDQVQVFTLKNRNKETGVWEDVTPAPTLDNTIPTGMISSYSRTASQSWDKDITKDTTVTESVTYTYTFTKGSSGGGSSGGGGGRKPTVTIPDDVPTGLNGNDHFAYIVGYPDGNVKPGGNITRAEVATIFFRLLTEDVRTANSTQSNSLSDVSRGQWFNHAISTLSSMGIVKGNPDGTFDPDAPITRAEFAAIAARFDDKNTNTTSNFSDIASHWAKDEIGVAANKGWINGYPDSTFRPDQYITRAEAMTLVNRVLNRLPEKSEDLLDDMIKWPDNADASVWYYLAVQEATNSHDYSDKSDADKYEKWTKLRENRDWTELEK